MTKKHFEAIASVIYQVRQHHDTDEPTVTRLSWALANLLYDINPRFNRNKFIEACERGECDGMRQPS